MTRERRDLWLNNRLFYPEKTPFSWFWGLLSPNPVETSTSGFGDRYVETKRSLVNLIGCTRGRAGAMWTVWWVGAGTRVMVGGDHGTDHGADHGAVSDTDTVPYQYPCSYQYPCPYQYPFPFFFRHRTDRFRQGRHFWLANVLFWKLRD